MKKLQLFIKRLFDFLLSLILLIVLSPLFLIIAILIKLDSEGEVFFKQERAGLNGKPFMIYKFRTMVKNAEKIGDGYYTGENDPRITRIGRFLRKTSLDELPQLINILKGEMSIIGPRPTLMYQVEKYDDFQRKRLLMKPGVTGLAQVYGRNSLSWPERIKYDVYYVENWNLWMDIKIFFKTFLVVLKGEGVYAEKEKFIIKDKDEL
ncbi:sugar transferase [Caloramator australicus]|uniref:Undecaprenyl-phosphate galactosephosphotransferase n=1 Tax=Caloramator australicus RC3 TaxID=857293 RepID=I7LHT2_9CLOT|nr:sugar transferase [Caloramator australicus]CCJ34281.1 Undecaprenyl-phosphate galactosephosphotransferase [Caloramator australicus RC3]